jgi:hypothetical protein
MFYSMGEQMYLNGDLGFNADSVRVTLVPAIPIVVFLANYSRRGYLSWRNLGLTGSFIVLGFLIAAVGFGGL